MQGFRNFHARLRVGSATSRLHITPGKLNKCLVCIVLLWDFMSTSQFLQFLFAVYFAAFFRN